MEKVGRVVVDVSTANDLLTKIGQKWETSSLEISSSEELSPNRGRLRFDKLLRNFDLLNEDLEFSVDIESLNFADRVGKLLLGLFESPLFNEPR